MSVSLIVAELVTNSLKHAFHDRSDGALTIVLAAERTAYTLTVTDDGPGLPRNFGKTKTSSLGQGILQSLASQLQGEISFEPGPGTVAKLVFNS
jgi:two-component sensor histidine kinase